MNLLSESQAASAAALGPELSRRRFLQVGGAALASSLAPQVLARPPFRVGVGQGSLGYGAAQRAMEASGEWPDVAGRLVVIKPNLVRDTTADTGAVTDPEIVRAVVDQALQDGAAHILIVEAASEGAHFDAAGYGVFNNYDPNDRVKLLSLNGLTPVLAPNPQGWVYKSIWAAALLRTPGAVFVNIAKMKTHMEATVTLASKNLVGIPDIYSYLSKSVSSGRFAMHERGLSQTILDLNLFRPTDFAIIDGIWAMEGLGPLIGTPVAMNTILAGRNAVAVDRVALAAMGIGQDAVRHLNYLTAYGLGPGDLGEIDIVGDALNSYEFLLPPLPPDYDPPQLSSAVLDTATAESVTIATRFTQPCFRTVEVVRMYDDRPDVQLIRTVVPTSYQADGVDIQRWDGRADDLTLAPRGRYGIRVTARATPSLGRPASATSWLQVV